MFDGVLNTPLYCLAGSSFSCKYNILNILDPVEATICLELIIQTLNMTKFDNRVKKITPLTFIVQNPYKQARFFYLARLFLTAQNMKFIIKGIFSKYEKVFCGFVHIY